MQNERAVVHWNKIKWQSVKEKRNRDYCDRVLFIRVTYDCRQILLVFNNRTVIIFKLTVFIRFTQCQNG